MKFLSFLLIIPFLSFSQEIGDLKAEMAKLESVPQAPEAYTFKEYGNNNINLNLGIPDISVEVYTHQGKEMKLPITLNYDASGVKVSETASWVGLKWNLNYGGRIDRIVNGLADEKTRSGYRTLRDPEVRSKFFKFFNNESPNNFFRNDFENVSLARESLEFLQDIKDGCIDTQPDYFKMSALGESEHIILDYKNNFKPIGIDNHRLKVSVLEDNQNQIKSWTVILDNGVLLEFKQFEEIITEGSDNANICNVINSYYASWMLTKIISSNGKDIYRFYYSDFELNNMQFLNESVLAINKYFANTASENWNDMSIMGETPGQFKRKQSTLDSISYNSKTFLRTNLKSRRDLDINNALESISIIDRNNNQIKKVKFLYSYFGNTQDLQIQSKRLKLDGLKIYGKNNSDHKSYSFNYISPEKLPSINSKSRDLWGFNNGKSNNVLFPIYEGLPLGGNRDVDFNSSKIGTLNKITYPTGGFTNFEYESNTLKEDASSTQDTTVFSQTLNQYSREDGSLYYDRNGIRCDDFFGPTIVPKISIKRFSIDETGYYKLSYNGDRRYSKLVLLGPEDLNCVELEDGTITCNNPPRNYCQINESSYVFTYLGSKTEEVRLKKGMYISMLIFNDIAYSSRNTSFRVSKEVTNHFTRNKNVGGLRIKKISDHDSNSDFIRGKLYDYNDSLGISTAVENFKPKLISHFEKRKPDIMAYEFYTEFQTHRQSVVPTGNLNSVNYKKVSEYNIDNNENFTGKTNFEFYTNRAGVKSSRTSPFENSYLGSVKSGKKKKSEVYDNEKILLEKENVFFEEFTPKQNSILGLAVKSDFNLQDKVFAFYQKSNGKIQISHLDNPLGNQIIIIGGNPNGGSSNSTVTPGGLSVMTDEAYVLCKSAEFECARDINPTLKPIITNSSGKLGGLEMSITKEYLDGQTMETEVRKNYDSAVDYLPRNETVLSNGQELSKTTFYYPKDSNVEGYQQLIDKNKLTEVVHVEKSINETLAVSQKKDYKPFGNKILPYKITSQKGNTNDVSELHLDYLTNGNLKETKINDGTESSYIWGYEGRHIIAKIDNTTYSRIESYVPSLQSLSNHDIDSCQGLSGCSEANLRNALKNLREAFPEAQVTTYTYDPLIGVTSITDPRGETVYYEYDGFNRLEAVRDAEGNLLEETEYNYKN